MDSQFNTLISSYRDNLIEYKLTGNKSNQSSYMSAKKGIDNILASVEGEVNSNKQQISGFYNDETKTNIQKLHDQLRDSKLNFSSSNDQLEAAKMRSEALNTEIPMDMSSYYMTAGGLVVLALLLSIF